MVFPLFHKTISALSYYVSALTQICRCDLTFWKQTETRRRGYITVFILNSTVHEISTAHKKAEKNKLALKLSDVILIILINAKMQNTVGILTFMRRIHFILS